ncbi:MAG TPA: nucleotide disphospho-sugar-binding domain-containing protein [Candidatus Didemnitutus sp.]|nr:nucleotide disphospho-sugar-binding domain-containing protein [Candidatus Didemnitutus sp.]
MHRKKIVLFLGEAVSLAHVARPAALARMLDPERHDIHLACDERYRSLLHLPSHIRFWPIQSSQSDTFTKGSDRGGFVWQPKEIEQFVREEIALFEQVRPDLIVADFRFSVCISAESRGIPYATLVNAYWSPHRQLGFNPVPEWPLSVRIRQRLARLLQPWKKSGVTAATNVVREAYGLPPLKGFLDLVTRGTYTLYPEPPGLIPTEPLPASHRFLGAVLWSPEIPKPAWWRKWDPDRPLLYVTLGSTGAAQRLPAIVRALRRLPVTVIVATAGRIKLPAMPDNVFVADYLPGTEICGLARGVVCNGGSATAYQALSQGTPVVGLWSNLDQYLAMTTIERAGAGLCARASSDDAETIHALAARLLQNPAYRAAAGRLATLFHACQAGEHFPAFIDSVTAPGVRASAT